MRLWGFPNIERLKARRNVPRLITALEHPNEQVRLRAAEALGEVGDERAVGPLAAWLRRNDDALADRSAQALGEIGRRLEAGPSLAELLWRLTGALWSHSQFVRWSAVHALEGIGSRCLEALTDALEDLPWNWQASSDIAGLWRRLGPPAVERLVIALADPRLCAGAAIVLGKMGGDQAFQALVAALRNRHSRSHAARALKGYQGPGVVEPLARALGETDTNEWTGGEIIEALAAAGPAAVEPLMAALEHNLPAVRWLAAKALGELRDDRALTSLVFRLEDADRTVRDRAAKALLRLGWQPEGEAQRASFAVLTGRWEEVPKFGDLAIEPLLEAFEIGHYRREAAEALAAVGDERAVAPLLKELRPNETISDQYPRAIAHALEEILARSAPRIAEETLRVAAELHDFTFLYCEDPTYSSQSDEDTISTSRIAELARNELQRRAKTGKGVEDVSF